MLRRFLLWFLIRSLGPTRAWGLLLGLGLLRRVSGRKPLVERMVVKKGDHITVDQLAISHKRQIRQMRKERRRARRAAA